MTGHVAVETEKLGLVYKRRGLGGAAESRCALQDVTMTVHRGEIFGLLGPNGAGKTTLIDVLATKLPPTAGRARVAGFDIGQYGRWVRPRIGLVSEASASRGSRLTVGDSLKLSARWRGVNPADADRRIRTYLDGVGLGDHRDMTSAHLTCGVRQRVDVVRGVLHAPVVLFADQPTRGLDASAGPRVRTFLRNWQSEHIARAIVLATNDLDEADEICDRVAIIDHGRVVACDTPSALKRRSVVGSRFCLETNVLSETDVRVLTGVAGVSALAHRSGQRGSVVELVLARDQEIGGVLTALAQRGIDLMALTKPVTTLRDAFLSLVARHRSAESAQREQWVTP